MRSSLRQDTPSIVKEIKGLKELLALLKGLLKKIVTYLFSLVYFKRVLRKTCKSPFPAKNVPLFHFQALFFFPKAKTLFHFLFVKSSSSDLNPIFPVKKANLSSHLTPLGSYL